MVAEQAARRQRSTPTSVPLQAALVVVALATIVLSTWLADRVTVRAILRPTAAYSVPYETHGGTVFISQVEQDEMILSWVVTAALVGTQLWLNRARLRPRG